MTLLYALKSLLPYALALTEPTRFMDRPSVRDAETDPDVLSYSPRTLPSDRERLYPTLPLMLHRRIPLYE